MKKMTNFFIYILLFYLMYTPNIGVLIGIDFLFSKYIIIPLIAMIFCCIYIINKKKIKINKTILFLFIGIIISEIYFILRAFVAGYNSFMELRIVQNLFIIVHIVDFMFVFKFLKDRGYNKYGIINLIFNTALIQSFICIIMCIFPSVKELANTLYFSSADVVTNSMKYAATIRIYGISEEYTFITQIFHALLASIALVLGILKNKKYIIYIPFFMLASILNGRTSIVIFLVSTIISMMLLLMSKKYANRTIKYISIIVIVSIIVLVVIHSVMPSTFQFIYSGINQIYIFIFESQQTKNVDILINDMTFWPEGINFIFGEGHRVYEEKNGRQSDIGYVNDMFMGGLIYTILLYGTIIIFLIMKNNNHIGEEKTISMLFSIISIVTLMLSNYKGECMKGGILLVMILCMKILFNENDEKVDNIEVNNNEITK